MLPRLVRRRREQTTRGAIVRVRVNVTVKVVRVTSRVRIGYARYRPGIGTSGALTAAGCEQVFTEKVSGSWRRPELDAALRTLRAGDQLVVTKLDRPGPSLEQRKVDLVVLDQGVDTSTAVAGCSSRFWGRRVRGRAAVRTGPGRAGSRPLPAPRVPLVGHRPGSPRRSLGLRWPRVPPSVA